MKKTKRFLSLLTSTAIAASAFSALVIPASAEDIQVSTSLLHSATFKVMARDAENQATYTYDGATEFANALEKNDWLSTAVFQFSVDTADADFSKTKSAVVSLNGTNVNETKASTLSIYATGNSDYDVTQLTINDLYNTPDTFGAGTGASVTINNEGALGGTTWIADFPEIAANYSGAIVVDITDYIKTLPAGTDKISLAVSNSNRGININSVGAADELKPKLDITLADEVLYNVNFNTNAYSKITINGDETAYADGSGSYVLSGLRENDNISYTIEKEGYTTYEGNLKIGTEDSEVSQYIYPSESSILFTENFEDIGLADKASMYNYTGGNGDSVRYFDKAMQFFSTGNGTREGKLSFAPQIETDGSYKIEFDLSGFYMSAAKATDTYWSNSVSFIDENGMVIFGVEPRFDGELNNVGLAVKAGDTTEVITTDSIVADSLHITAEIDDGKVKATVAGYDPVEMTLAEGTTNNIYGIKQINNKLIFTTLDNIVVTDVASEIPDHGEPTAAPTQAPTAEPTTEPTQAPTEEPSGEQPAAGQELINEDFSSTTGAWGFEGSGGANIENKYLILNTNNKNGALTTKTLDEAIKSADSLSIKFDWASNVEKDKDRSSAFELRDENNTLLFAMYGKGGTKTDSGIKYGLVDGTWIDIEKHTTGKWYTVELNVNFSAKTMSVSIKDTAAGTELVNVPSVDITAENLAFMVGNDIYSLAPQWIDNVLVKTPDTYALNVTVNDTDSTPIDGATVEAVGAGKTAVTNSEGKAMLVLQNGNYKIKVSKPGYYVAEQDATVNGTSSSEVTLTYAGEPTATTVTISGGDEYVYQPKEGGQNKTVTPYTAVVYDQTGQIMTDADVTWTVKSEPTGATIDASGIVTIDPTFNVTDINGQDITIVAASGDASAETTLHVRQAQKLSSFAVAGANVIKYGKTAEYSVVDEKDQYGEAYGYDDVTYTLAATNATTDGMNVTATDAGTQLSEIKVTITSSNEVKAEKTVTGYGYDFYEPGVGETTYAENASMITLGDENVLAWPTTPGTGYITLPDPVELTPGSAKLIKFKLAETTQSLVSQIRTLDFQNAEGVSVFADGKLWNAGGMLGFSPVYENKTYQWIEGSKPVGSIGAAGLSTWIDCQILIKTANDGVSSVIVDVGGDKVETTITADDGTGARVDEISKIELVTGTGVPDVRNLAMKDIIISDSDVAEVEIAGDDHIAKAEGKVATKSYRGAVYTSIDGETFTWSVSGEGTDGGAGSDTAKAEFTLYKAAEDNMDAVAIFPVYEDGVLKSLTTKQVSINKGDTTVSIDADADDTVFLWSSLENAQPLAPKAEIKTVTAPTDAAVSIDQNGVLSVKDTAKAGSVVTIRYTSSASTEEAPRYAEKQVTINDFANVDSFEIDGPAAVNAGDTVTYKAVNIKDEYGDIVDLNTVYAVTAGTDIATIDPSTGVLTTSKDKTGNITVSVTVGNTGKTKTLTKDVYIGAYSVSGTPDGNSVEVDVTGIANYSANTEYLVTTAKDGVILSQTETKSTGGKVVVDTTGADAYEVSPIYFYDKVGNVSGGKEIALADGYYDFTFKKANGTRADIFVNGYMVGQNVDQYGAGRSTSGSYYTVKDVKVSGGSAVVTMKDQTSEMTSIEVKKSPSIIDRKTHVYILGDSLVANYYDTFKDDGDGIPAAGDAQTGWGQVFDKFVTDEMNVTNLAESGNYAKGLYDSVFHSVIYNSEPGDYLLFECGYNDSQYSNATEMQETVKKIAEECAAAQITPIFITPNASAHGTGWKSNVRLSAELKEVCEEIGARCIDLAALSYNYYSTTKSTVEDSHTYVSQNFNVYFNGAQQDALHSSYYGAMKCAEIVAQGIYDMQKTDDTLSDLKINTDAKYDLVDSEGGTITMQVK